MASLAITYSALGRLKDALVLFEKSLEICRIALPENHPQKGTLCFNFSIHLGRTGYTHRATEMAWEALRIFQATLPPSHPDVKKAQDYIRQIELTRRK